MMHMYMEYICIWSVCVYGVYVYGVYLYVNGVYVDGVHVNDIYVNSVYVYGVYMYMVGGVADFRRSSGPLTARKLSEDSVASACYEIVSNAINRLLAHPLRNCFEYHQQLWNRLE